MEQKPKIMGIINVTPDSFYSGSRCSDLNKALKKAETLIVQGADILDIGGESTRPGAQDVSVEEECSRVLPVIEAIAKRFDITISIDSKKTVVMQRALDAGAIMINDVNALGDKGAVELVSKYNATVCLMHAKGTPDIMQQNPQYDNVMEEIFQFLFQRIEACKQAGVLTSNIIIDPGFGFGKTLDHNLTILGKLEKFKSFGVKLLIGLSRKSMFGQILNGKEPEERLYATLGATVVGLLKGADIIRTHDCLQTKDIIDVIWSLQPYLSTRSFEYA